MAGTQRQTAPDFECDSRKQNARPGFSFGPEKRDGTDAVSEDWCDSGLDSLGGVALGVSTTDGTDAAHWQSETEWIPDPESNGSENCVSVGGGDRLDSAIGESITDETVGRLSAGIGTIILSEPVGPNATESGQTGRVGATSREEERQRREELFNTLNFLSEDGDTALHLALIHEQWGFVDYLLSVIALDPSWTQYLDIQNDLGQTALHLAVIVDQWECVRGLLWGGANAELQERGGNTPLHLAVREQRVECVRELTACPRTPQDHMHVTNFSGVTALHLAVQKGNYDIIGMLLKAGADVNQRDLSSGRSPLHWAVESQKPAVVELLLWAGAMVDQRSYAGHTPLYCAIHRPNKDVQELLRAGGATHSPEDEEDDEEEDERESEEEEFDDVIINGQRVL
ncbi:NF-kappa-B inhibitor beta [Chanos chanos]|uniref:NF-kappa-B inhibitor alpha n=1 Tax=Chanos chanos TaxID=29144 RepID=A0A6J2W045_CHACN|nr:NF-kappa-B inhibitor beta-like [Chanos chanos]